MMKKGLVDAQDYANHAKGQMEFKDFLDQLNMAVETPMKDKAELVVSWNKDHPELQATGNYVKGLPQWMRANPDNLTLTERADLVADLNMKVEQVFTEEELGQLADALTAQAQEPVVVSADTFPVENLTVTKVDADALAPAGKEPENG